jgi:hypothetical protein
MSAPLDDLAAVVGLPDRDVVMKRVGAAPCQWFSAASKNTRSPGRITSTWPPSRWQRPTPSVTQIV